LKKAINEKPKFDTFAAHWASLVLWKVEISLEKDWVSLNDIKVEGGV